MKIIAKDNFNRETVSDYIVCENVNHYYGNKILEFLKDKFESPGSDKVFHLVEDNHKLYKFEP